MQDASRHGKKWNLKLKPEEGSALSTRIPTLEQRGIIHGREQTKGQRFIPGEAKRR